VDATPEAIAGDLGVKAGYLKPVSSPRQGPSLTAVGGGARLVAAPASSRSRHCLAGLGFRGVV
jgi:hypothetical protein